MSCDDLLLVVTVYFCSETLDPSSPVFIVAAMVFRYNTKTNMAGEPTGKDKQPVIIVGAGLAGLVAAFELSRNNIPVILIDQENEGNLGGQAYWSLGGIFCVDSTEQRRLGIKDSRELAMQDWFNSARFDREKEDFWPKKWAEAFVNFATDEMEQYLKARGMGFLFNVGWAERGDGRADGHGNSVPRFHITWGVGPEIVRVFAEPVQAKAKEGVVEFKFRHMVDELILDANGRAVGVKGRVLEADDSPRGVKTNRDIQGPFELYGSAVLVSSGGIGGNVEAVKAAWPIDRLGPKVPENFVVGVPAHVDGRMIAITEKAGGNVINKDRMWQYVLLIHVACLASLTETQTATLKVSPTGIQSGPTTASVSSRPLLPSGSTPQANVSPLSSTRGPTPSPR